jgi:hypothetical protein
MLGFGPIPNFAQRIIDDLPDTAQEVSEGPLMDHFRPNRFQGHYVVGSHG